MVANHVIHVAAPIFQSHVIPRLDDRHLYLFRPRSEVHILSLASETAAMGCW